MSCNHIGHTGDVGVVAAIGTHHLHPIDMINIFLPFLAWSGISPQWTFPLRFIIEGRIVGVIFELPARITKAGTRIGISTVIIAVNSVIG